MTALSGVLWSATMPIRKLLHVYLFIDIILMKGPLTHCPWRCGSSFKSITFKLVVQNSRFRTRSEIALTWMPQNFHDDVIKRKHFPRHWPFVWGIHRSPVNSPHKGQWRGALMFSLICAWKKRLINQSLGWWIETPPCSCHGGKIFCLQEHAGPNAVRKRGILQNGNPSR